MLIQPAKLLHEIRDFISGSPNSRSFEQLALGLFELQFNLNAPYRRFCEMRGITPKSIPDHWNKIPAVPASAFKELELTILPPPLRTHLFYSSGTTTQKRSRHFHSPDSIKIYEQSLLSWFKPFVLPDFDRISFLVLTPPVIEAPNSSLVHMFQTVVNSFGTSNSQFAGSITAGGEWEIDPSAVLTHLKTDEPKLICGTAFSFVHLCDGFNSNVHLPQGSRIFETGGYKGKSRTLNKKDLHTLISQKLGVPLSHIISEYGMSELSSQAYDRRIGEDSPRQFQFPPWVRIEIISPETSTPVENEATGLLRIYDLANVASVMAIQTEDLAGKSGNGFELLGRAALAEPRGCSLMNAE